MRKAPAPGQGHRRSKAKVGRSDSLMNPTKSIGLPHSHGSMNTAASGRSEHTRAETKPEGKVNATPRLRRPALRIERSGRRGNASDPTRPLEVRGSEGKTALTRRRLIRPEAPLARCPTHHHSRRRQVRDADAPPAWRSSKGAIGAAQASQDRERGTERSRRERGKIKNSKLGKRVAGATWAFPRAREELKAIAQRKRGANGLCTAKPYPTAPRGATGLPEHAGAKLAGAPQANCLVGLAGPNPKNGLATARCCLHHGRPLLSRPPVCPAGLALRPASSPKYPWPRLYAREAGAGS
ncbi:hypothetical protein H6P81_021253 [Aristolochia fimbriata]|uniref:Uncharacterized protein n=1 Tax=Aristolochia fimbriata TaxID=158543 RepID=A0AAV7DQI3_ARIFI|nr:hypothetical protein H6P81_021253 [Aristolochia fimbriata]